MQEWNSFTPDGRRLVVRREEQAWVVSCDDGSESRSDSLDVALIDALRRGRDVVAHSSGIELAEWTRQLADRIERELGRDGPEKLVEVRLRKRSRPRFIGPNLGARSLLRPMFFVALPPKCDIRGAHGIPNPLRAGPRPNQRSYRAVVPQQSPASRRGRPVVDRGQAEAGRGTGAGLPR
jgi:hypothetical protein